MVILKPLTFISGKCRKCVAGTKLNKQINTSPQLLRDYIHELESGAGMVAEMIREKFELQQHIEGLKQLIITFKTELKDESKICEQTIAYGKNRYRISSTGQWAVLMWGWWPNGNERPSYRWVAMPEEKIPEAVRQEGVK